MEQFSYRLIDEPQKLKDESMRAIEQLLRDAVSWRAAGIEAVAMCSDYCMNAGPFLSPELFAEFVTPFLKLQVAELRKLGFYTIKHTDGNIMPIIDQLAECAPDALHSLDPQGGVDIAEVKKRYGDRLCLIGNVNCGLMDTGRTPKSRPPPNTRCGTACRAAGTYSAPATVFTRECRWSITS